MSRHAAVEARSLSYFSWDGILNDGESGKGALNRLQFEQREIGVRIVISIIENHQLRKLNY